MGGHESRGFEWDDDKALKNFRKHGVKFEEATEVWRAPRFVEYHDEEHSTPAEPRYQRIGLSGRWLLFVVFTVRAHRIPIIHARKADGVMRDIYEREA